MTQNSSCILLNPGPVNLTQRVRNALLRPDLCHREVEFFELQASVRKNLLQIYPDSQEKFESILLTGSGTAAVEAMLASFIPRQSHTLVVANGVYGERMAKILSRQGKTHDTLDAGWTSAIDLEALDQSLSSGNFSQVVTVHHETTTGRLNPLRQIEEICHKHSVELLLDAVSSFGAEEIRFSGDSPLVACSATANKCLHGVPGISFVLARKDKLDSFHPDDCPSLYFDLKNQFDAQSKGSTAFTQSVQVLYALDEALQETLEGGGWKSRQEVYRKRISFLIHHLETLGIRPYLSDPNDHSSVLTSFYLPQGMDYPTLHDRLKEMGFVIYSGQGNLSHEIFRISTMGDIPQSEIERLAQCFTQMTQESSSSSNG